MRYAALFRAINVGGKNAVPMAELRLMLEQAGFTRVKTLLQSGNATLDTDLSQDAACARVEEAFTLRFGFHVGTLLLSADEWARIVQNKPFTREQVAAATAAQPETEHLYVYFLKTAADKQRLERLAAQTEAGDIVYAYERVIYLLCQRSVRLSKTALRLAALFPEATARNWNTVEKMYALLTQD
jgi:uncharacterized protein (DUF1697 family)